MGQRPREGGSAITGSDALDDRWDEVIRRALRLYDITDFEARRIRHGENLAVEITARGANPGHYLLRVHAPVSANLRGIQHTFEGLRSEAAILEAFRRGTGIPLQMPIPNRAGLFAGSVPDPSSGESYLCTMLSWIDGETPTPQHEAVADLVAALARQAARLHAFARTWQPGPVPLIRPVYDAEKYLHQVDRLEWGLECSLFSPEHYAILRETMTSILELFGTAPRTPATWGIIHADLSLGNSVIRPDGQLVPIDFCFAGYGYYLFDVGGTIPALRSPLRRVYLEAYQGEAGELSPGESRLIDACFLLSIFGGAGFHVSRPSAHEWIARRMPVWAGVYCRAFLEGQSPVFSDA